ncbi:MAG: hemolysin III family protein [Oxalobacter sp.]|nr:MAG: hemolysin III family protein [Oxalobacter sp.]
MSHGEKFNAITHLIGAVLAVAGAIVMIVMTSLTGDMWKITSAAIYGASLVMLYLFSTLYHSLHGRAKRIMRELDHGSIYLLIAGTYTPICLVTLRDSWGWILFGVIWGLAVFGCLQELWSRNGSRKLSLVIYMVMGWVGVIPAIQIYHALGLACMLWLAIGGLLYSIGIIFYILGRRRPYAHGIWHLFVLAGSAAHYIAIVHYVL